ncbi:phytanoyl-CoA dioxygenase family protein [Nocardia sp. alder85J]|uniref:phytanoyl-CoA dioxygenase family protein n=1 Tax=Nocardia sp. alder85J TaxID=2862949 RepID=UPI001CD7B497|nr:phytanoyl-CoA dioxygenase family protein [Nocardia sp. alder85J]MCX4093530.1 phytanoyl-CoA dioxygenase family protein [Nocardia sp. alder85J]
MLTDSQIESFVTDGYVRLERAFPPAVAAAGREILWQAAGVDPHDRTTWTAPVIRLADHAEEPFRHAVTTPALTEAFDQLIGSGRWLPRNSLGGWPIRFPSDQPPGDDGWHIDASFPGDTAPPDDYTRWRINVTSRGRALLMLFLFSDVGPDDAPTRIRVGSHLRLAKVLEPYGDPGAEMFALLDAYADTADLPTVTATGRAGDVYLCHPFLVHAAQPHRGHHPKFMAQPPLLLRTPCTLNRPDNAHTPLERAIRLGLTP